MWSIGVQTSSFNHNSRLECRSTLENTQQQELFAMVNAAEKSQYLFNFLPPLFHIAMTNKGMLMTASVGCTTPEESAK
jgi:hypothetical protein